MCEFVDEMPVLGGFWGLAVWYNVQCGKRYTRRPALLCRLRLVGICPQPPPRAPRSPVDVTLSRRPTPATPQRAADSPVPRGPFWSRGPCGNCGSDWWTQHHEHRRHGVSGLVRWSCFACGSDEFDPPARRLNSPGDSPCLVDSEADSETGCRQTSPPPQARANRS